MTGLCVTSEKCPRMSKVVLRLLPRRQKMRQLVFGNGAGTAVYKVRITGFSF